MAVDSLDIVSRLSIAGTVQKNYTSGRNAIGTIDMGDVSRYLTGTVASQMDTCHVGEYTIASGATLSLDLAGTTLRSPAGDLAVFAELALIYVKNSPMDGNETANTTNIQIGGGTNCIPLFADATDKTVALGPNSVFFMEDPDAGGICAVTAGTGDILTIVNSAGASAKIHLFLGGRSV